MGLRDLSFWVSEPTVRLIAYLTTRRLAGQPINVVWDYYVKQESPAVIARRYGLTKTKVRGIIQRCAIVPLWLTQPSLVAEVVREAVPVIIKRVPVVIVGGRNTTCRLCGARLTWDSSAKVAHIRRHRDVLAREVASVLEEILTRLGLRDGLDLRALVDDVLVRWFGWTRR